MQLLSLSSLVALLCLVPVAGAYDERVVRFEEVEIDMDSQEDGFQPTFKGVSNADAPTEQVDCNCTGQTCSCCADVKVSKMNLDDRACLTVTDIGDSFTMDFTLGGKKAFSTGVSDSPLPSPCISLGFGAQLCVEFYNVKLTPGKGFGGCVKVIAKMMGKTMAAVDLGCFYF